MKTTTSRAAFDRRGSPLLPAPPSAPLGASSASPPPSCFAANMAMAPPSVPKMTPSSQPLCDVLPAGPTDPRMVRFHSSLRIRSVPSRSFMSDEERRTVWYCEDDLDRFKDGIRKDVKHMRRLLGHPAGPSPEHRNDTAERCCRGIEHFATRDALEQREASKDALIKAVLRVQTKARSAAASVDVPVGDDDESAAHQLQRAVDRTICEVSARLSLEARSRAADFGASDRAFVAAEEAGLRALLASHNLASTAAPTDMHGGGGDLAATTATPTSSTSTAASSLVPSVEPIADRPTGPSLKRSACSAPDNMMAHISISTTTTNSTSTTSSSSSSSPSPAVLHAYEQFATHRRRRLSLLRGALLQSMTMTTPGATDEPPVPAQHR